MVMHRVSVALEVCLSIMYVSREQPLHWYKFELFKKRVVWFAGSRVWGRTSGLPGTINYF